MMGLKYCFSYDSFIRNNVTRIFFDDYNFTNVFDNDRSALMSRIDYVERNEPRR